MMKLERNGLDRRWGSGDGKRRRKVRCMGRKSREVKDDSERKGATHTRYSLSLVISVAHTKMSGRKKWKGEQSASLSCVKVFVFCAS